MHPPLIIPYRTISIQILNFNFKIFIHSILKNLLIHNNTTKFKKNISSIFKLKIIKMLKQITNFFIKF